MCGIIGYIGEKPVTPILLNGLARLEYRGYDSSGIAVLNQSGIEIYKAKGRLSFLRQKTEQAQPQGFEGIGHTRLGYSRRAQRFKQSSAFQCQGHDSRGT